MLAQISKTYPQDVRVVYRHFPLIEIHANAVMAARASEAANKQGKFWEYHDMLFAQQRTWSEMPAATFETWLKDEAKKMGLDENKFSNDLKSDEIAQKVEAQRKEADSTGLPGTPSIIVNGRFFQTQNVPGFEDLSAVIKMIRLEDRQFNDCPPLTISANKQYIATLKTEKGEIVAQLFPDKAPTTVNSFIFLAKNGWYDKVEFHRVLPGFVAQAGDPSGTGYGGPGYAYGLEVSPNLKFDKAGILAIANAGADSNGSQFFITLAPTPDLNGKYTIFGQVIQGLDVVQKLTPRDPSKSNKLPPGDLILSVTIDEK